MKREKGLEYLICALHPFASIDLCTEEKKKTTPIGGHPAAAAALRGELSIISRIILWKPRQIERGKRYKKGTSSKNEPQFTVRPLERPSWLKGGGKGREGTRGPDQDASLNGFPCGVQKREQGPHVSEMSRIRP